jgi:hypothetical protein
MTSNLLIGYHDIERDAVKIEANQTVDVLFPYHNAGGGHRGSYIKSFAATNLALTYTLAAGVDRAVDYIFLPRLRQRVVNISSLQVRRTGSHTVADTITEPQALATQGRLKEDYFKHYSTPLAAANIWRLQFNVYSSSIVALGAPYLGTLLDLQADMSEWSISAATLNRPLAQDSGTLTVGASGLDPRRINATWEGVSALKTQEWQEKVLSQKETNSFLLYAGGTEFSLDMETILHARLISSTIERTANPDWHVIRATFREDL